MAISSINHLPDELVDCIIGIATAPPPSRWYNRFNRGFYTTAASLARVNRRFHRMALPHLYCNLYVDCGGESGETQTTMASTRRLYRTIARNPELWPLCRRLAICFPLPRHHPRRIQFVDMAVDFLTWFTEVRALDVFGLTADGFDMNMPLIPLVLEAGSRCGFNGAKDLQSMYPSNNTESGASCRSLKQPRPIRQLCLSDFSDTQGLLAKYLQYPAGLEIFELDRAFCRNYGTPRGWNLATLCELLSVHQTTLRVLRVHNLSYPFSCCYSKPGLSGVDLSTFSALRHLTISRKATGTDSRFVHCLLSPRLYSFGWDLTTCRDNPKLRERLCDLGAAEEEWLRALARAAFVKGAALRQIEVMYAPTAAERDAVYPWDRLELLAGEMKELGIALQWNTPSVSREKFEMSSF